MPFVGSCKDVLAVISSRLDPMIQYVGASHRVTNSISTKKALRFHYPIFVFSHLHHVKQHTVSGEQYNTQTQCIVPIRARPRSFIMQADDDDARV